MQEGRTGPQLDDAVANAASSSTAHLEHAGAEVSSHSPQPSANVSALGTAEPEHAGVVAGDDDLAPPAQSQVISQHCAQTSELLM